MGESYKGVIKVDNYGRVTIPSDLRNQLGIKPSDYLFVKSDGNEVTVEKVEDMCLKFLEKLEIKDESTKKSAIISYMKQKDSLHSSSTDLLVIDLPRKK